MFQEALEETQIQAELTTVDNGQELMDNLKDPKEPNPDIIFLDINMPVKDGKECLEEIKQDKELKDIPTVMYTTSTDSHDIEDTYKAGADLYVPKPVSFNKLVLIIKKIFSFNWNDLLRPIRKTFLLREKDV